MHARNVKLSDFGISAANSNNTEGFLKLSEWLKGKKDISITFPKGIYYIGQQKNSPKTVVENIQNIFTIENASGITIIGNGAKIKYVDRLMYGAFEIGSKKKMTHNTAFSKAENAAYPGNCIKIYNSNNINISNLELDGNIEKMIIGGRYGDVGIQLWHRGFYIINSYDVRLKQVNVHHFGLDGIELSNEILKTGKSPYQLTLSNVSCKYNGRQGISWVGGNGLFIENSTFSYSGRANICSAPGAGIDIEPEVAMCKNGLFVNCKFEDNCGPGFVSDLYKLKTANIVFNACTFYGTTACAVWAHNADIHINNSTIIGQILSPAGGGENEKTVINHCDIYDYNSQTNKKAFFTNFLIDAGGGQKFYEIVGSTFYLKYAKLCYIESGSAAEASMPLFKNNTVYFNHDQITIADFVALFRGCILQDNRFDFNIKKIPDNGLYLVTGHTMKFLGKNTILGKNSKVGWNSPGGLKSLTKNKFK
jgi:hypothetical protein